MMSGDERLRCWRSFRKLPSRGGRAGMDLDYLSATSRFSTGDPFPLLSGRLLREVMDEKTPTLAPSPPA